MNLIRRGLLSAAVSEPRRSRAPPSCGLDLSARSVPRDRSVRTCGATDIIARFILQELSKQLGQQFYVENIPVRAATSTGIAAKAAADGYTVLFFQLACHESLHSIGSPTILSGFRTDHAGSHLPACLPLISLRAKTIQDLSPDQNPPGSSVRVGRNGNQPHSLATVPPLACARPGACPLQRRRARARSTIARNNPISFTTLSPAVLI